jgi:flagellar protein FlbD
MIVVTRLNEKPLTISCELIECIEDVPDTVITMTTGRKIIVQESIDEIIEKVVEYKQKIFSGLVVNPLRHDE